MRWKSLIRRFAFPSRASGRGDQPPLPPAGEGRGESRRHLRTAVLLALTALVLLGAAAFIADLAWTRYARSLGPIDLAASRQGSTVVLDRDGRLLRPFTMADGIWRVPATIHDVDPRYIAMLIGYEDGRFYEHDGVDLRASFAPPRNG